MSEFWFPCYANDLLGSFRWKCMTPAQRGAYWQLICWQMQAEDGMLPGDVAAMGALADLPLVGADACILDAFPLGDSGKRANPRAYAEWLKRVGKIQTLRDNGRKGSDKRYGKGSGSDVANGIANATPDAVPVGIDNHNHNQNQNTETEKHPPTPRKRGKRPQADAGDGPDPFGWEEFARVYPGFRLKPDKAAKAWFRRNVSDTSEGRVVLAQILGNVSQWLKSEQWIQGRVPNCSKYLDENIWQGIPGPPPYRSGGNASSAWKGAEN